MQPLDFDADFDPQLGVEIGQRLVEQEHLGFAHQSAADGHALALAAGKLRGLAAEQMLDLQQLCDPQDRLLARRLRHAAHVEAELHVLGHVHVRVEGVGLEHHGDVAVLGVDVVDHALADADLAGAGLHQPGDDVEQGGLAAAGRPQQHQELAVGELDIDLFQDFQRGVAFLDAADAEGCHDCYPLTAPAVSPRRKYLPAST